MTTYQRTVTDADTAERLGSGDMPVLATPRLINWCERAAFTEAAADLEEGQTTVGTTVRMDHVKGTPVRRADRHRELLQAPQRRSPPDLPRQGRRRVG